MERKPYPSDVSDDEWAFMAPYLTLMTEEAPQREHDLRWIVRTGAPWRMMPHDLPPWAAVYQQGQRWRKRGVLRLAEGRNEQPSATILDSRTMQSSPESGQRAGSDGATRRKGSKVHLAVDTLGHLLALHVTPANEQDRAQVAELAEQVQAATGDSVEVAFVDEGYTGEQAATDAARFWSTSSRFPSPSRFFLLCSRLDCLYASTRHYTRSLFITFPPVGRLCRSAWNLSPQVWGAQCAVGAH